ncbi:MAG: FAD-dependent monooxygenase [Bacteroidota bacterium]
MISIIGGGIGGLTTALAFEKEGIDYCLYERTPELRPVGAGIWLAPNALQVYEWLGILDAIRQGGNAIDRITLAEPSLQALSDTRQEGAREIFGYTTVAIHRAVLQETLLRHLPADKVKLGKAFKLYEQLPSGRLKIDFEDGTAIETDELIAADGIHSKVRQQLFPSSRTRYSGQSCWRGIADFQPSEDFRNRGFELWGDQMRFGFSRITEGQVYWFAVISSPAHQTDDREQLKVQLLERYQAFHPMVKELIEQTPLHKIIRSDINDLKPLDRWYAGNICLVGDAGHATTPNMGQGGAQAIEDAYFLAKAIGASETPSAAFPLFQKQRFKKANDIVWQSWLTGQIAHCKYGQWLRNLLMKSLPKSFLQKKMMEVYQLG